MTSVLVQDDLESFHLWGPGAEPGTVKDRGRPEGRGISGLDGLNSQVPAQTVLPNRSGYRASGAESLMTVHATVAQLAQEGPGDTREGGMIPE